jgi:type IV pilus assembly protein PilW
MISMVIGLFIVLALLTLLINVNRNNGELTKTNRIIENGRFSLQVLADDVAHAGYLGGYVPAYDDLTVNNVAALGDFPTGVPDPCQAFNTWDASYKANLIATPVQSYPVTTPTLTIPVCGAQAPNLQANNDVLVVRHLETESCVPGVGTCPTSASEPYFQMNRCWDSTSPGYSTSTYVFGTSTFTLRQGSCTPGTPVAAASAGTLGEIRKFASNLYFIRNYSDTAGDGIPTLMRSQFGVYTSGGVTAPQFKPAEALVSGIDGFRVEFGVDSVSATGAALSTTSFSAVPSFPNPAKLVIPSNRGDGYPDGDYVHCPAAGCTSFQLMNTVAAKIYILVRSETPTPGYTDGKIYKLGSATLGPFNDAYKRHLFTQTVRLSNISSRRETPPS